MGNYSHFSLKSQHALNLIDEVFFSIDLMTTEDREDLMHLIVGWLLIEKHGEKGRPVLQTLYGYCVANCLLDDPTWTAASLPINANMLWERLGIAKKN